MAIQRNTYCFISDENKKFYRAIQQPNGNYAISFNSNPYPVEYNPTNLEESEIEFSTNKDYFSLVRNISFPLDFVKDAAAILRYLYRVKKGISQKAFLTIVELNPSTGIYELSYYAKIELSQKTEDHKLGKFTVPTVDDSAWGVLSQNDNTVYAIDCSVSNPKSVRVLFDGINLENIYTFQTTLASLVGEGLFNNITIPLVLINQSGDSYAILAKPQTYNRYVDPAQLFASGNFHFTSFKDINNVKYEGVVSFRASINAPYFNGQFTSIYFYTSKGVKHMLYNNMKPIIGKVYELPFSFSLNLESGEQMFLFCEFENPLGAQYTLNIQVRNFTITTKTTTDSVVAYGLRAVDLLKQLVAKATNGRFTIDSEYFTVNNKDICLSGDSIRGIQNAKIYSSFNDWFASFDAINFLAMRAVNGFLFVEKATEVYRTDTGNIIDLGEIVDFKSTPAEDMFVNEVEVGSPIIDYRHPSGRLEFNSTNLFSINFDNIKKKKSIVSKYRLGCYDIIFLILDYQGQSNQDNSGDKSVYVVKITDEIGYAEDDIETFENINVNNSTLEPIIKSPYNDAFLTYNKPTIKGVAPAGSNVNIYCDSVLDGGTTADSSGNWSYEINTALSVFVPGVDTGIHLIEATFTDLSAPSSSITVTIDSSTPFVPTITYPDNGDNLYNNKPLIKGRAEHGTNIDIELDGVPLASVLTDNSGFWTYKVVTPLTNANHLLSINSGADTSNFTLDARVALPLITYIGSELDGFILLNNLPLIEGVALPGTIVDIWLNYIPYSTLGTVVADANGVWSFQVVPKVYLDPLSGLPVELAPIRNGLSVVSTSLINHVVSINVTGYKLSRPLYSSITGVIDNTVFNTEYSPKRMLLSHGPSFSAMLRQNTSEKIHFQKPDKNGNLRTVLNGVAVSESADVPYSSLGNPIALLEYGVITTKTITTFAKTLYNFVSGGLITGTFRGTQLYFLPIGSMKMSNIHSDRQEWKLLFSPNTSLLTLLNLYKNGTTINLMQNAIYHSDYNSLHGVQYDFVKNPKYNSYELYEEWFENRNGFWLLNPGYIQKYQTSEVIIDQIITNGVSNVKLKLYRCSDAYLVDTIDYNSVANPPIPPPTVILEAVIDMSVYPEDQYFTVMTVSDTPVMIFERFQIKEYWEKTILIEASNSINLVGAYFSTGFKTILRLDGIVKKWQPNIKVSSVEFESGDTEVLYSQVARKRNITFGSAYGEPDYMALKIANACTLDNLIIEQVAYSLADGETIEPSEEISGHPLFYYDVVFNQKENVRGLTVPGAPGGVIDGVVLVTDAVAFGLPPGSLININIP